MPHITQRQIAKKLGVHPSTVSLALRGDFRIPKPTRDKLVAEAEKLGYQRDPMLAALAAYRRTKAKPGFRGVLAWLVHSNPTFDWRSYPEYREYHAGATQRAGELGYRIEIHDASKYGSRPKRLLQIFRTRGIRGVLVCPLPQDASSVDLDFSKLSAVTFGYSVRRPELHVVAAHHFDAMQRCARELCVLGCRRIGYALPRIHNERLNGAYLAAFRYEQSLWGDSSLIPPCEEGPSFQTFSKWFKRWKPDGLITAHYKYPDYLEQMKVRIPDDLRVALVSAQASRPNYAGNDEISPTIGALAVELLTSMVERGQHGLPESVQCLHVKGRWRNALSTSSNG